MTSPSKSAKAKGGATSHKGCIFCDQGKADEDAHGKLLTKAGITAHYFCMLFSSGLSQNGKTEKHGVLGFLPEDIMKEVRRGSKLKCSYCRKAGATIGCVVRNCKKMFHLGCGRNNSSLHQFFDTFSSFCPAHRPKQDVPEGSSSGTVCSICMNSIATVASHDTIRAPCCSKDWYHRDCVQRYATSAGLYFFKCPLCNNKDDFQHEMLTYGIYIPDQDASWETEPHAYQDLLERYRQCDAQPCKCVEGRKYDKDGSKWEIILCDFCGSSGSHIACKYLVKCGKHEICPDCNSLDKREKDTVTAAKSPGAKRLSLQEAQLLDLPGSPNSPKQGSPYPGPSDKIRKTGIPKIYQEKFAVSPKARPPPKDRNSMTPRMSMKSLYKSATVSSAKSDKTENVKRKRESSSESLNKSIEKTKKRRESRARKSIDIYSVKTNDNNGIPCTSGNVSSDDGFTEEDNIPLKHIQNKASKEDNIPLKHIQNKANKPRTLCKDKLARMWDKPKRKRKKRKSNLIVDSDESDTDTEETFKSKETIPYNKRLSLMETRVERNNPQIKDKRLSLGQAPVSKPSHKVYKKKRSLDNDKSQLTLMNWLKTGTTSENISPEEITKASSVQISSKSSHGKPRLIEWRGKQLLIRSPRVLLRKTDKIGELKPRNLEIDMCDKRTKEMDLLNSLESDVRVTRKMVDAGSFCDLDGGETSETMSAISDTTISAKFDTLSETSDTMSAKSNPLLATSETTSASEVEIETKAAAVTSNVVAKKVVDSPAKNLRQRNKLLFYAEEVSLQSTLARIKLQTQNTDESIGIENQLTPTHQKQTVFNFDISHDGVKEIRTPKSRHGTSQTKIATPKIKIATPQAKIETPQAKIETPKSKNSNEDVVNSPQLRSRSAVKKIDTTGNEEIADKKEKPTAAKNLEKLKNYEPKFSLWKQAKLKSSEKYHPTENDFTKLKPNVKTSAFFEYNLSKDNEVKKQDMISMTAGSNSPKVCQDKQPSNSGTATKNGPETLESGSQSPMMTWTLDGTRQLSHKYRSEMSKINTDNAQQNPVTDVDNMRVTRNMANTPERANCRMNGSTENTCPNSQASTLINMEQFLLDMNKPRITPDNKSVNKELTFNKTRNSSCRKNMEKVLQERPPSASKSILGNQDFEKICSSLISKSIHTGAPIADTVISAKSLENSASIAQSAGKPSNIPSPALTTNNSLQAFKEKIKAFTATRKSHDLNDDAKGVSSKKHVSDKSLMVDYYSSESPNQKSQGEKSGHNNSLDEEDIMELPQLIGSMIGV